MGYRRRNRPDACYRGYGWEHKQLRAEFAERFAAGEELRCWRCEKIINPREPWDLGHDDFDRSRYRGPEHRACNRATELTRRADPAPQLTPWWMPPTETPSVGPPL